MYQDLTYEACIAFFFIHTRRTMVANSARSRTAENGLAKAEDRGAVQYRSDRRLADTQKPSQSVPSRRVAGSNALTDSQFLSLTKSERNFSQAAYNVSLRRSLILTEWFAHFSIWLYPSFFAFQG